MRYEVEQKFPVDDLAVIADRLDMLGASVSKPKTEEDLYFAHPARDFAKTDEALRIRRKGDATFITYKGPKVDTTTKTRREIELPLPSDEKTPEQWTTLLEVLGFRQVAMVRKSRRKAGVLWDNHMVEGCLDNVEGLGCFVELELVVEEDKLDVARHIIASLAESLELRRSERRSYLELLLEKTSAEQAP